MIGCGKTTPNRERADMPRIWQIFFILLAAAGGMAAGPAAQAQTKPAVTSLGPDFPKTVFSEFAGKDSEIVRAHGAKPVFFMSWAYADKPEMTAQLAEAYTVAGNANNALVIPAGLAFARAIGKQPELNLYAPDKRHPSLGGTYLAACVVFAALTGRSPVGNPYLAGIDP